MMMMMMMMFLPTIHYAEQRFSLIFKQTSSYDANR